MEAYIPNPNASRDARNIMAVSIAQGMKPEDVVSEMIKAIIVADFPSPGPVSSPEMHRMASWAIAEIGAFVKDIQERMGHMVRAAAVMNDEV